MSEHDALSPDALPSEGRRGAISLISKAVMGALGMVVLLPGAAFIADPLRRRFKREVGAAGERAIRVASASDLAPGAPLRAEVITSSIDAWTKVERDRIGACWLIPDDGAPGKVRALSTVCPHLGCAIDWTPGGKDGAPKGHFNCPCHRSVFDAEGRRVSGPSPRDMDALEAHIADGGVFVAYRRFPHGAKTKKGG
jgi:Rieske Fe-S protein